MTLNRPALVILATAAATAVNLLVFVGGLALGVPFRFPGADGLPIAWGFVAGLTAVPLGVALTAFALVAPRRPWATRAALVAAPVVALGSIPLMPVSVGFDLATTVALAIMHVVVGTFAVLGVLGIRRRLADAPQPAVVAAGANA